MQDIMKAFEQYLDDQQTKGENDYQGQASRMATREELDQLFIRPMSVLEAA